MKTLLPVLYLVAAGFICLNIEAAEPLTPAQIKKHSQAQVQSALQLYRDFLRLPNDANYPDDILKLVAWLEPQFTQRGFAIQRLATAGSPLLFAEMDLGKPTTLLVYLQADGQPVDPSAWQQPDPFEPALKQQNGDKWEIIDWDGLNGKIDPDWRIFARSASDSKGPMAQFFAALDAMHAAKVTPDFNLKVIVDTEEELGSPNLAAAVQRNRDLLDADMLMIFDGPPHASNQPTLNFGARGIARMTLTVFGPKAPQHSGHYGNFVPNPALRLSQLLASMKDPEGRVIIEGFYEGIALSDTLKQQLAQVPDDPEKLQQSMGIGGFDQVAPSLQQALQYPSLNIRGLRAAWVGKEVRTVIPANAVAELDIRLVKESRPEALLEKIRMHIRAQGYLVLDRDPSDEERLTHSKIVRVNSKVSYGAFRSDFDALPGQIARNALTRLFGKPPIQVRTLGGSVPIAPFVETLDIPAVLVPTVNIDNNQHSPNENIRLGDFMQGIGILMAVLSEPVASH